jgi:hypothetical protein
VRQAGCGLRWRGASCHSGPDIVWRNSRRGRAVNCQVRTVGWAQIGGCSWRCRGSLTSRWVVVGSEEADSEGLARSLGAVVPSFASSANAGESGRAELRDGRAAQVAAETLESLAVVCRGRGLRMQLEAPGATRALSGPTQPLSHQ